MADECETTQEKRIVGRPFEPGNPGRPKGSKNKLVEDFLGDVLDAWKTKGKAALDEMIADKPGDFVKMVAGLVPKEATLNINDHSELTDDQLAERVRILAAQLAPFLSDGIGTTPAIDVSPPSALIAPKLH